MKKPLTAAGTEPTTFRFVAQHLNDCATAVPTFQLRSVLFIGTCSLLFATKRSYQARTQRGGGLQPTPNRNKKVAHFT